SSNRGAGGTTDNPYETTPILVVRVPTEPAADAAVPATSQLTVAPIARSHLAAAAPSSSDTVSPTAAAAPAPPPEKAAAKPSGPPKASDLETALQATRTDRGIRVVLSADELFGSTPDTVSDAAGPLLAKLDQLITTSHLREVVVSGNTDS